MDTPCPRCGGTKFTELDCGPDGYDDDVTWTSYVCQVCELRYSGWTHKWLVKCDSWSAEEYAREYQPGQDEPAALTVGKLIELLGQIRNDAVVKVESYGHRDLLGGGYEGCRLVVDEKVLLDDPA